jgi:predicted transcriptional regulator
MLDCEAASKLIIPAFRVAVARKLVLDYGISQSKAASIVGVKQASVSKYLKTGKSDRVSKMADFIHTNELEMGIVEMAASGYEKVSIVKAIERASSDPHLVRNLLSTKELQLLKKTTPK